MADSSLDDFFAKKDKSKKGKKKDKSKFTTSDILAKQTEEPKKEKKKVKEKTTEKSDETTEKKIGEDEEWNDFEDETSTDYSGLRIQTLQISSKDEKEEGGENAEGEEDDGSKGEGEGKIDTSQGIWSSKPTAAVTTPAPEPEPEPPKPAPEPEPPKTGKYIPPAARAAAAAAAAGGDSPGGPTLPSHIRRKKQAPNIMSEMDFPTLGGGGPGSDSRSSPDTSGAKFERVKGGGKYTEDTSGQGPKLNLGNKFDALSGGAE